MDYKQDTSTVLKLAVRYVILLDKIKVLLVNRGNKGVLTEGPRTSWGGGGGRSGWLEERKVVPSGCTVQPAARARAARTSFMSARAGSGKLPCCRSPASMRLVMARRCRSRSFVRSFSRSRSRSRSPRLRGEPPAAEAGAEANPRGRRCGGGDGDGSPSRCGGCFMALGRSHPPAPAPICGRELEAPHARNHKLLRCAVEWASSNCSLTATGVDPFCHVCARSRPLITDRTVHLASDGEQSSEV